MRSQRGLRPGPPWGSLQCSPRTVAAGLRGGKREGTREREERWERDRGGAKEGNGGRGKMRGGDRGRLAPGSTLRSASV